MTFCNVEEVVPKALMAVIPEKFRGMKYHKAMVGEQLTIVSITVVSYQAKNKETGEFIERKDGTPVYNQNCYFELSDGTYTTIRNDKVLGQVAMLTGWYEDGESEQTFDLKRPEKVEIIEIKTKMGKKEYPVRAFKSIE